MRNKSFMNESLASTENAMSRVWRVIVLYGYCKHMYVSTHKYGTITIIQMKRQQC